MLSREMIRKVKKRQEFVLLSSAAVYLIQRSTQWRLHCLPGRFRAMKGEAGQSCTGAHCCCGENFWICEK
jgi:hypothetical protein